MGRNQKYGEPTKILTLRLPESKYEAIQKRIQKILEEYYAKIEVIINKEPSDNNCYNCGNNVKKSSGSSCDKSIYSFDTCKLTDKIVEKGIKTELIYDDGRVETMDTADYIGNKGCNKWIPREK